MVEVEIDQQFPKQIMFEDELGCETKVAVEYDWLPITCQQCKGIGNLTNACRKKIIGANRPYKHRPQRQVWRPKQPIGGVTVDPKEFPPLPGVVQNSARSIAGVVVTPTVTPAHQCPGSVFTPARIITRITRHESRVTGDHTSGFTVNYNAEMAKASSKTGPMTKVKPESLNRVAGGRVWILWKHNKLDVVLIDMDAQYIHVSVINKLDGSQFFATFVYAFNKLEDRVPLWNALIRLARCRPWVVLGDFNNVMFANERIGKIVQDEEMLPFKSTVALCDLQDIKSTGAFFTWNNKQPSETRIFSRIDRVLVNVDGVNRWSDWFAHFQPEGSFDHCPCLVSCGGECQGRRKPFKFFNMWTKVPDFQSIVLTGWNNVINGTAMFRIVKKLKLLKSDLKGLNRGLFSDIERNADVPYKLLLDCQLSLQQDKTNKELMDKERDLRQS
ncbi:uncharacterized protein LOC141627656 [Silene latifolia]|uniref:uncharacterized protein LOC141627656 n=1 Tax=Silene latifolia TaxID=37657 RepID=UPI003D77C8E3